METMDGFQFVQAIASLVLPALLGGYSTVAIAWLKEKLGTSGATTYLIVASVAVVVSIVSLLANGYITQQSFTTANLYTTLLAVIIASQVNYRRLKDEGN